MALELLLTHMGAETLQTVRCGELALEEAVDLSKDRLRGNDSVPLIM